MSVEVTPVDASSIDPLARGELDFAIAPRLPAAGLDQFVARKLIEDHLGPVPIFSRTRARARARTRSPATAQRGGR